MLHKSKEVMMNNQRRNLLGAAILGTGCHIWSRPVVDTVILPAHAQTSVCVTDETVGGPIEGNPAQADSCPAACEFVAQQENAQLCLAETTELASGTECSCELDLPGI